MYKVEQLIDMETVEHNLVYGELKLDTDKQRIYIDDENQYVHHSVFVSEFEEWDTESYTFENWNNIQGIRNIS